MTVRKGEPWGTTGPAPEGLVIVGSDAELTELVTRHRRAGTPLPPVGLLGGDLCRAVGGTGEAGRFGGEVAILPVDLLRVEAAGEVAWAAAHVIARRWWGWRGQLTAVMNAQFVGRADVAPRAHPGDGQADIVTVDAAMPVRARWHAWRRLPTASHLPHAAIRTRRAREAQIELPGSATISADGRRVCRAARLHVTVEPDALTVCV